MIDADKGQDGARTQLDAGQNAEVQAMLDMLATAKPEPLLPGLEPDTFDLVGRAAEQLNAQRRARGRPAGSANKRNEEVFEYLEARGFKQPEMRLMEIISADPFQLAMAIAMQTTYGPIAAPPQHLVMELLQLQTRVAADLMPYKFAKRQQIEVNNNKTITHVMMAGRLTDPTQGQSHEFSLTGQAVDITPQSETALEAALPASNEQPSNGA